MKAVTRRSQTMTRPDIPLHARSHEWLAALAQRLGQGLPQVLVTVVRTQGSTPRDVGARMWVGTDFIVDTIGGGHLEWKAIALARMMLEGTVRENALERFPLGPGLGQCCGGVVWLMFEYFDNDDASWCARTARTLARGGSVTRTISLAGHDIVDVWSPPPVQIVVCGAGHIGTHIVKLLGDLPFQVTWLDPRACWPDAIPGNVRVVQGDADDVPDMPDNACWLILTHNHALDLAIIDAVFRHKAFAFLGLIGSRSKKARFVSRLAQRHPQELVKRMVCPIGVVQTSSKLPAAIAVSVVAQLLELTDT